MRIGMIGLGKLGFPYALTLSMSGHEVIGYDRKGFTAEYVHPVFEQGDIHGARTFFEIQQDFPIVYAESVADLLKAEPEIVFVCVPTPHDPEYDGAHDLPAERKPFDLSHLESAVTDVYATLAALETESEDFDRPKVVAVISTVLPGDMVSIFPYVDSCRPPLIYSPCFSAMGTVIKDLQDPDIVLVGMPKGLSIDEAADIMRLMSSLWQSIVPAFDPGLIHFMSIPSAELTKCSYNTFIGARLAIVNVLGEICSKVPGADMMSVSDALRASRKRVSGPAYLRSGMGDGGACHPRDNIAMSYLARKLSLHFDIFDAIMVSRERQAEMFARWIVDTCTGHLNPKPCILGVTYKPDINLIDGSHVLLIAKKLETLTPLRVKLCDPFIREYATFDIARYNVVFIGAAHTEFVNYRFARGTTILDPHRIIPPRDGITIRCFGVDPI